MKVNGDRGLRGFKNDTKSRQSYYSFWSHGFVQGKSYLQIQFRFILIFILHQRFSINKTIIWSVCHADPSLGFENKYWLWQPLFTVDFSCKNNVLFYTKKTKNKPVWNDTSDDTILDFLICKSQPLEPPSTPSHLSLSLCRGPICFLSVCIFCKQSPP